MIYVRMYARPKRGVHDALGTSSGTAECVGVAEGGGRTRLRTWGEVSGDGGGFGGGRTRGMQGWAGQVATLRVAVCGERG